ncbi:MAG: FAD-dependent oxidoreductase [Patescibacteria group bacterium]|nr:FAD-dependent oxidoreductase [Patescibacteria group bacterium]
MEKYKYLIIGGGVAGLTAAETIRSKDSIASVAIVNDEPYTLYSRVMLSKPNFFLGEIPFDSVWLKNEDWYKKNNINFFGGKKAVKLDSKNRTIILSDDSALRYEKLLIATGVQARKWNFPNSDKKGIYYLRTLEDGRVIMNAIKSAKRAITIGGGFISFETADLLKMAGIDTTMIIRENYFWEPLLDEESGRMIEGALKKGGIKIIYKSEVKEIVGKTNVEAVILQDNTKIECNMIICGIGVYCDFDWLKDSGLKTNRGILADEYLKANLPDVWVAGDVAEFKDITLDETIQIGNWVNAREHGRIAGLNMIGEKIPFKFVSFYTTQGLGISIAFVGDVRSDKSRIVIKRGSPQKNSYGRVIILDKGARKEIEGATLINRTSELAAIAKLIEKNIDVSDKLDKLGDDNFDLKSLIQ